MGNAVKQLRSSYGFESPYFIVDNSGNLVTQTVTVTGSRIELTAGSYISYSGVPLLTQTALGSTITSIPGTLTGLKVGGTLAVTGNISLTGSLGITSFSPGLTGSIDNMTIGLSKPVAGTFSVLTVSGTNSFANIAPSGQATIAPLGILTVGTSNVQTNMVGNITVTSQQNITISPTAITVNGIMTPGTGLVTINPQNSGTLDNMLIGSIVPATATFTYSTQTTPNENWNTPALRNLTSTKRYAENIAVAMSFFSMGQ